MNLERTTSRVAESLANRILTNSEFGSADLTSWLVERLAIKQGMRLLDVGCGTARHLARMAEAGAVCTGIDISGPSLATAKDAATRAGVDIRFIQCDMNALPEIGDTFDLITSIYALYYAKDAQTVLNRLLPLLATGGAIAIFGPYDDNNREWFDFIAPFLRLEEKVIRSTTSFMYEDVLSFAMRHFEYVTCERFVNTISIPSQDDLRRYWRSNIYYKESADPAFEAASSAYFKAGAPFTYRKVGQLIRMTRRFR